MKESWLYRSYRFGSGIDCIFRDDGLSDLIGFTYSSWHAEDAVANLVGHMENIAAVCPDRDNCLITIILDGENAWEYYPENGYHFLRQLYTRLAEHPQLRLTHHGAIPGGKIAQACAWREAGGGKLGVWHIFHLDRRSG